MTLRVSPRQPAAGAGCSGPPVPRSRGCAASDAGPPRGQSTAGPEPTGGCPCDCRGRSCDRHMTHLP